MDGTLATAETWKVVLAWIREHHPSPAARRFVAVRLPAVVAAKAGLIHKETFRARWLRDEARLLRGLTAAQIDEMVAWVVDEGLWPTRREAVIDRVQATLTSARALDPAARLVLASGAYQPIAEAFARRIGADVTLATPLVVGSGVATGELAAPTQSGGQKAAAVRALAAGAPVIAAFGDTEGDIPLLAMASRAVAVAPDKGLRREAAARGWEIIEGD